MWIDATSGAGPLFDPKESQVSDKVAFANAPIEKTPNGSHWLWSWAFAIPKSSKVCGCSQEVRALGYFQGIHQDWLPKRPGGQQCLPERENHSTTIPSIRKRLHLLR